MSKAKASAEEKHLKTAGPAVSDPFEGDASHPVKGELVDGVGAPMHYSSAEEKHLKTAGPAVSDPFEGDASHPVKGELVDGVGAPMHYYGDDPAKGTLPLLALVTRVHSERCVDIAVIDGENEKVWFRKSVMVGETPVSRQCNPLARN